MAGEGLAIDWGDLWRAGGDWSDLEREAGDALERPGDPAETRDDMRDRLFPGWASSVPLADYESPYYRVACFSPEECVAALAVRPDGVRLELEPRFSSSPGAIVRLIAETAPWSVDRGALKRDHDRVAELSYYVTPARAAAAGSIASAVISIGACLVFAGAAHGGIQGTLGPGIVILLAGCVLLATVAAILREKRHS